jgi:hypothetical protein
LGGEWWGIEIFFVTLHRNSESLEFRVKNLEFGDVCWDVNN